ncbi:MAG TPA: hypothetical protein VG963_08210, partial [Polyangiaceae bacterium]|nr:hypothetical protein [Polyangiaceae bacterium]
MAAAPAVDLSSALAHAQAAAQTAPAPNPTPAAGAPVTRAPEGSPFFEPKASFAVGLRAEFVFDPSVPPPGDDPTYQVNHDVRPYISGQVNDYIKFEGNLDSQGNDIRVLDAVLKFELHEYANFWVGHFLPP